MSDVDWCRARELMAHMFMGDDEEYLFGDFHPSHVQEYAGGLLLTLEKPGKDHGGVLSQHSLPMLLKIRC